MSIAKQLFGGGGSPTPAALPDAPTANTKNTSQAVADQSTAAAGRAANESAGNDPALQTSTDPYSVKKKLLGA